MAQLPRFRTIGENNVSLAKKAFDYIAQAGDCEIYVTDVEHFFDTISHKLLKRRLVRLLGDTELPPDYYAVYKAITKYSYVEKRKIYNLFRSPLHSKSRQGSRRRICTPKYFRSKVLGQTPKLIHTNSNGIGVPQGSSLSPLLSNIYMADLDSAMNTFVLSLNGAYWRYCDDILIVIPRGNLVAAEQKLDQQLEALALKRNIDKTHALESRNLKAKPLQFLGFTFDGSSIVVRPSSIHRYHRKLKKAIQAAEMRRKQESRISGKRAPLRQQALYNMYSELPIRGDKARRMRQKHPGNFTRYMSRSAKLLDSPNIEEQRRKVLRKFRTSIRKHK